MNCNVCQTSLESPVYESARSLTSLCELRGEPTRVRVCGNCGHVQTDALEDADAYYDEDYEILTDSEEEDQIYEIKDGKTTYRTDHQLNVLLEKLELPQGAKVLDFGCAKSSMMRGLLSARPDLEPHMFDVSDRYVPFWEKFASAERWAVYELPDHWDDRFDAVTSFFSLEHVTAPADIVADVRRLLKPGGTFYGVVPNVYGNSADLIVIDHANHFTTSSLDSLLSSAGLAVLDIDDSVHRGAYVWVAQRPVADTKPAWQRNAAEVDDCLQRIDPIAKFWSQAANRVREFESTLEHETPLAVYGGGFYGTFIHASLERPGQIRCFLDQNPYLHGKSVHESPILPPGDLPRDIRHVLVGLNPAHAESVIADIDDLNDRDIVYFYL